MDGGGADVLDGSCPTATPDCPFNSSTPVLRHRIYWHAWRGWCRGRRLRVLSESGNVRSPGGDGRIAPLIQADCAASAVPCYWLDLRPIYEGNYALYRESDGSLHGGGLTGGRHCDLVGPAGKLYRPVTSAERPSIIVGVSERTRRRIRPGAMPISRRNAPLSREALVKPLRFGPRPCRRGWSRAMLGGIDVGAAGSRPGSCAERAAKASLEPLPTAA